MALALIAPAANMALRAAALGSRLLLAIYMARYFSLEAIGSFGLILGATGIAPAIFGCGLNYGLGRELVGLPLVDALWRLRDRLLVSAATLGLGSVLAIGLSIFGVIRWAPAYGLALPIVALECLSVDLHFSLISLRQAVAANGFLFWRSAAWIFPAIAGGLMIPSFRSLDFLLGLWLAGLVLAPSWLLFRLRHWPWRVALRRPIDFPILRNRFDLARLIYPNDIALVGMVFVDRFVVDLYFDRAATGLYFLAWSIANAVFVLVNAAVLQPAVPILIEAFARGRSQGMSALRRETVRTIIFGLALCGLVGIGGLFVYPHLVSSDAALPPLLFLLLLGGTVIRLVADMLTTGLYAQHLDAAFATLNLGGLGLAIGGSFWLISQHGPLGAAILAVVVPLAMATARLVCLRQLRPPADTPAAAMLGA